MSMGTAPNGAWVTERGTVVPSWTPPHNLDLEVKIDGRPLGFKVGQMLPERRWAVDEFGHCLPKAEFTGKYQQWFASHSKKEEPQLVSVPDRLEFISGTYDLDGKATTINFDPGDPGRVKPSEKYDHKGDLATVRAAAANAEKEGKRQAYRQMWKSGDIDAGRYAELLEALESKAEPEPAAATEAAPDVETVTVDANALAEAIDDPLAVLLTTREREVVEFVGKTGTITDEMAKRVAERLGVAPSSVRAMASKARQKLRDAGIS